MIQHPHSIRTALFSIASGLLLSLFLVWIPGQGAEAEEQPVAQQAVPGEPEAQTQTESQAQPSSQQGRKEQEAPSAAPPGRKDAGLKEAPGPIKFELTSRAELKYDQILFDKGHLHRYLFVGSYVFAPRMTIGFDELPLVDNDTGKDSNRYMLGDAVLRYSWVPYISSKGDSGLIFVTQLTTPTGDYEKGAGNGRYDLEPRLFFAHKVNSWYTVVPAVYDEFTVAKKENGAQDNHMLTLRLINLFFPLPGSFITIDPRFYYDFKKDQASSELRFQFGNMLTRNITAYIEYYIGLGEHKPYEGRFGAGLRYLFR